MQVVIYYRTRPSEPAASKLALLDQHSAVKAWLQQQSDAVILSEHVEGETDGFARPALREAMSVCKKSGAALLIARTEAIGSDDPFEARIASLPVQYAPATLREIGHVTLVAARAPKGLYLDFRKAGNSRVIQIYLSNRFGQTLRDVQIRTFSTSSKLTMMVEIQRGGLPREWQIRHYETPPHTYEVSDLTDGHAVLIGKYDLVINGEFITGYEITFKAGEDTLKRIHAFLAADDVSRRFFEVKPI